MAFRVTFGDNSAPPRAVRGPWCAKRPPAVLAPERLLAFERLDEAWPCSRTEIERAENGSSISKNQRSGAIFDKCMHRRRTRDRGALDEIVLAVARKLAVILHRMCRDGADFIWSTEGEAVA